MGMLDGFREKDFLEQITILNDIAAGRDSTVLPGLRELFERPTGDTSVDYMVVGALNAVLGADEDEVVRGLASESPAYRTVCVRVAGECAFASAGARLCEMAERETDPDLLIEILGALSKICPEDGASVFRNFLGHEDPMVAAMAMEMSGVYNDRMAIPFLKAAVEATDAARTYDQCDITTWKAIDALAAMNSPETVSFLAANVHHLNPTARRLITDALVRLGEFALPYIEPLYLKGDTDQRILACNIAGFIGSRKGAGALVGAFDAGAFPDPNSRYAAYEALGRMGTLKGLVCLVDGLSEDDELILMAVVSGLERHSAPGVLKAVLGILAKGDAQGRRIARAIVAARAVHLFRDLYLQDEVVGRLLMDCLRASQDQEVLDAFAQVLGEMGTERSRLDAASLPQVRSATRKALAVDDSRSMLAMYRRILTDLGFEPLLAGNGQEAFGFVEAGEFVDVVVTDMNMPVMDGMELTGKLRGSLGYEEIPILMVTTESEGTQRDMARKIGVTDFITKPFKPSELKTKLTELVGTAA